MTIDADTAPICTIFGGADGSGKSILIRSVAPPGELMNADEIARLINQHHPKRQNSVEFRDGLGYQA